MSQPVSDQLEQLLEEAFAPSELVIKDESYKHAGHREAGDANETHFRITIASEALQGKSRVQQHQAIYRAAAPLINNPIHALAIQVKH
jgi:BolA protein